MVIGKQTVVSGEHILERHTLEQSFKCVWGCCTLSLPGELTVTPVRRAHITHTHLANANHTRQLDCWSLKRAKYASAKLHKTHLSHLREKATTTNDAIRLARQTKQTPTRLHHRSIASLLNNNKEFVFQIDSSVCLQNNWEGIQCQVCSVHVLCLPSVGTLTGMLCSMYFEWHTGHHCNRHHQHH